MGAEASGCEMGGRGIAEPDSAEREGVEATPSRHGIVAPSSISARPTRLIWLRDLPEFVGTAS